MRAEIVSVGTELLMGQITDTNAVAMSRSLAELGISLYRRTTVGDNHDRLLSALQAALQENDIVLTIGGLGPTEDDITRDVLAEAMGDPLHLDEGIAEILRRFFAERNVQITESNLRQAMVPVYGRSLDNPNGTAPGLLFEKNGKIGISLPGPPSEFLPMLANHVVPYLRQKTGGARTIRSKTVRVCGIGEGNAEDKIRDLLRDERVTIAPYAKTGEVHFRVSCLTDDVAEADKLIEARISLMRERLGDHIYGFDEQTLEDAIVGLLKRLGKTVAVAESCTGGLLASRITSVPGCSAVFPGGVVSYSNEAKIRFLGVSSVVLQEHGAVSQITAEEMARNVRIRFNADYGISITGIAGPDGGSEEKPVGMVWIAISDKERTDAYATRQMGGRADIRYRSSQTALTLLRDKLLFLEKKEEKVRENREKS
jgi:nicotinamide-nucleotide amidase